jgi:hypothetical protein
MFERFNNNPTGRFVGDCAVRAISLALNTTWERAFEMLAENAFLMGDMPSSDSVWGATLRQHGFRREAIKNTCPDCYTIEDFAEDHPRGTYVLKTDQHVTTVIDGDIYDSWNTSDEVPQYYWTR